MQQRQPRLGDILDDYCPRERRLTNHVVVAMIGDAVKQTRCTTCDADHEYKHAAVPRQRKKSDESALYAQVLAGVSPKRVVPPPVHAVPAPVAAPRPVEQVAPAPVPAAPLASRNPVADFDALFQLPEPADAGQDAPVEESASHRRLIRAQLPKHEGQVATTRQATDFTIRQPNPGRPKRFGGRPRPGGAAPFQGARSGNGNGNGQGNANGNVRGGGGQRQGGGGGQRQGGGRVQGGQRPSNRPGGGGRNRSR